MPTGSDTYNLQRFIDAQEPVFELARAELAAAQKRSHWMWFIFPQIKGLGSSSLSKRFAISSLKEGAAYLQHPLLGKRLQECTALVNAVSDRSVHDIFGYPDDLKFHSSVTLFARIAEEFSFHMPVFKDALAKKFANELDTGTLRQLSGIR